MYLMYIDESGDSGLIGSPSMYYILSGIVIHELRWKTYFESLVSFRRGLKKRFGLKMSEEFHASALINHPGDLVRIKRNDRLAMIRSFADFISSLTDINIINIVVKKDGKPPDYDVFDIAWKALIQRFENTISRRNFCGPANSDERGMIISDNTDTKKLQKLIRKMHRFNPIPNSSYPEAGYRDMPLAYIIEDPSFRDSQHSFFIQMADLVTFLLHQSLHPSSYMKKKQGQNYFKRLEPVLCKVASRSDPYGVVRI